MLDRESVGFSLIFRYDSWGGMIPGIVLLLGYCYFLVVQVFGFAKRK